MNWRRTVRERIESAIADAERFALAKGWPLARMSIARDEERGVCWQLRLDTNPGRPHCPVFEVVVSFDLSRPEGPQAIVTERWLFNINGPDAASAIEARR